MDVYCDTLRILQNVRLASTAPNGDVTYTAANAPPPGGTIEVPPGFVRDLAGRVGYGVTLGLQPAGQVAADLADFCSVFGRASPRDAIRRRWDREDGTTSSDWMPSGAFVILLSMRPTDVVALQLPAVPGVGRWTQGSIMPQSNDSGGGPWLDLSLGPIGCSFDPARGNTVVPQHAFDGFPALRWGFNEGIGNGPTYRDVVGAIEPHPFLSLRLARPRNAPPTWQMPPTWNASLIVQMPRRLSAGV